MLDNVDTTDIYQENKVFVLSPGVSVLFNVSYLQTGSNRWRACIEAYLPADSKGRLLPELRNTGYKLFNVRLDKWCGEDQDIVVKERTKQNNYRLVLGDINFILPRDIETVKETVNRKLNSIVADLQKIVQHNTEEMRKQKVEVKEVFVDDVKVILRQKATYDTEEQSWYLGIDIGLPAVKSGNRFYVIPAIEGYPVSESKQMDLEETICVSISGDNTVENINGKPYIFFGNDPLYAGDTTESLQRKATAISRSILKKIEHFIAVNKTKGYFQER